MSADSQQWGNLKFIALTLLFPPLPPTEGLNFSHLPTQYPTFKTKPLKNTVSKNRKRQGHGEDFLQRCKGMHTHLHLITHQRTLQTDPRATAALTGVSMLRLTDQVLVTPAVLMDGPLSWAGNVSPSNCSPAC